MAQLRFSSLMCLDVAGRRLLDAAAARSPALWPERRLRFVVAPEDGQLLLLDDGADGGGSPRRSGLPAWVGAGIPVVAAGRAAAQQGGELGIAQAGMLLTLGASVRDLLEPANVADGSGRDCQASAVDCQASADCQAAAVAQLVTFRDAQQAAQRAGALARARPALAAGMRAPPADALPRPPCLPRPPPLLTCSSAAGGVHV